MSFTLHGIAVSSGIAIGHAHLISHTSLEVAHYTLPKHLVHEEVTRFDAALESTHRNSPRCAPTARSRPPPSSMPFSTCT